MQDRYVGDIGDYVKLSLLQALMPQRSLGIAWYRIPDEAHNDDGGHVAYLDREEWRVWNESVFLALRGIVKSGVRRLESIHDSGVLEGARYASETLNLREWRRRIDRPAFRKDWFERVNAGLRGCNLIFVDPDNGIEPQKFSAAALKAGKSVTFEELRQLRAPGRTLIVYHHQTHFEGGHFEELRHLSRRMVDQLGTAPAGVLRARPWSPRAFFFLDADPTLVESAALFAKAWHPHCAWYSSADLMAPVTRGSE